MSLGTGTVVAQYEKEPSTLKILKCATDANPLFEGLDDQQRTIVYGAFVEETYEADEIIIREGDRGDIFYVVETGAFDAQIKARGDETVAHYESGTGFGELALLYNSPRAATVRCIKAGRLWAIDRAVFNVIMIESRTSAKSEVEAFLNSSVKEVTQYFEPSHFDIFSQLMDEVCFSVGETIWRAGEPVDCLYFVREGEVSITNEKEEESYRLRRASLDTSLNSFRARRHAVLKRGDHYGSAMLSEFINSSNSKGAMISTRLSQANTGPPAAAGDADSTGQGVHRNKGAALTRVSLYRLRLASLITTSQAALGDGPRLLLDGLSRKAAVVLEQLLALSNLQRVRLLRALPTTTYEAGSTLSSNAEMLHVIVEGKAQPSVDEHTSSRSDEEDLPDGNGEGNGEGRSQTYEAGDCLDKLVFTSRAGARYVPVNVTPVDGNISVVSIELDLMISLGGLMHTVIRRTDGVDMSDGDVLGGKALVVPSELKHIAVLGSGGYGYVSLAEQQMGDGKKRTVAMKRMNKEHVYAKRQVDHINNERRLLGLCDHPFIIELFASFQDSTYIYLCLEVVLGGDLFGYLDENGPIDDDGARFHTACVCMGLEYLHDRQIAYRDLKPENLLFDARGFTKIVDFGFAKLVYEGEKTWTLCGTPEYLAPEVILRKGHDSTCDWWSLGVLLIEMLYGSSPFADDEHFGVFRRIVKGELEWSKYQLSPVTEELARSLLTADPTERLGGAGRDGGRAIRGSSFMKPIDFQKLVKRELDPPYVPQIDHEYDTRNCVDEDDLEEPDESFKNKKNTVELPDGKRLSEFFPDFLGTDMDIPGPD